MPDYSRSVPFRDNPTWEPLSVAAAVASTDPNFPKDRRKVESYWALCRAYHVLRDQMVRYADGEVPGHSFLVAGHRGSGKTLLAHLAIQITRWIAEGRLSRGEEAEPGSAVNASAIPMRIPFLVPLHGPDLLSERNSRADESKLAANAMRQIVLSLHRSFVEELMDRYADKCRNAELAAQLRIELNGDVELSTLRFFWEKAGLGSCGVLDRELHQLKQAHLELIALFTLQQASRILSAESAQEVARLDEKSSWLDRLLAAQSFKPILHTLRPVVAICVGLFLGWAVLGDSKQLNLMAAATFLIATAIVSRFLKSAASSIADPQTIVGRTLSDLDRSAPVLVQRVFDAGFAPIFVVDELDKIRGLRDAMDIFMRQSKYFVTDRAFFCFLTDRRYWEELEKVIRLDGDPYPVEQTFFGDRLFVHYTPEEIDAYLEALLQ